MNQTDLTPFWEFAELLKTGDSLTIGRFARTLLIPELLAEVKRFRKIDANLTEYRRQEREILGLKDDANFQDHLNAIERLREESDHPTDDHLPIDEAWLREIGFEPFGEAMMWSYTLLKGDKRLSVMGVSPCGILDGDWTFRTRHDPSVSGFRVVDIPKQKTRRDLRLLLEALGVSND